MQGEVCSPFHDSVLGTNSLRLGFFGEDFLSGEARRLLQLGMRCVRREKVQTAASPDAMVAWTETFPSRETMI